VTLARRKPPVRRSSSNRSVRSRLAEVERASRTGSFVWRPALCELTASAELCRIFGVAGQGMALEPAALLDAVHPEDRSEVEAALQRAFATRSAYVARFRIVRSDATVRVECRVRRTVASDPLEFIGTVSDVSQRESTDEALRRASSELARMNRVNTLGGLTASITHEVNQPLTAVVTNANACLRWLAAVPPNLEEATESLREVVYEGTRASQLIARFRIMLAGGEPHMSPLRVEDTIRDVVGLIRADAKARGVTVLEQCSRETPRVLGDQVLLQHLILNLAMNALEAMSSVNDRPRTLTLRAEPYGPDDVRVLVRDTGPGLDPHARERLFEPFFSTKPQGMGMGLAISRSIAEAHGGQLWVTPNEDGGETFQFTAPRDNAG
jgi:PAS domain S-box-containing protein